MRFTRSAFFGSVSAALVVIIGGVALHAGSVWIPISAWWDTSDIMHRILVELRLPRAILVLLCGALLSVSGAVIQSLFRNPLADPGLIGVSGGAAFAAVLWQVLGAPLIDHPLADLLGLPLSAFLGGVLVTAVVMRLSSGGQGLSVVVMLLMGIAVNATSTAGIAVLKYASDTMTLRQVTFWLMGNVQQANWSQIALLVALAIGLVPMIIRSARMLNVLLLGSEQALLLGVNMPVLQWRLIISVALLVGAVVSCVGLIGFVGLVVPHIVRVLVGVDNRRVLPMSLLAGGVFLLIADVLSRTLMVPGELPIGLITSLIGGPFFMALILWRHKGRAR